MEIHLGIDGGGTHTRAILVTAAGRVLGTGEAGPCNYHNVGVARAGENLLAATRDAWTTAGRAFQPATAAFLGLAGVKAAVDRARMTAVAEETGLAPAGQVQVENDLHNALTGGLDGRPGVALIAGTGTNCLGGDGTGRTFMTGGWGWLIDDVGGGFGLAIAAMRVAAKSADGVAPATRLLPAMLAFLGLSEPNELLARLYAAPWTPDELAAFAGVVTRLAAEGDAAALRVCEEGAQALAALVARAAQALRLTPPEVVLLGGCARSGAPYQPLVEAAIRRVCRGARIVEPRHSPLEGAALNALRLAGIHPLPDLIHP